MPARHLLMRGAGAAGVNLQPANPCRIDQPADNGVLRSPDAASRAGSRAAAGMQEPGRSASPASSGYEGPLPRGMVRWGCGGAAARCHCCY